MAVVEHHDEVAGPVAAPYKLDEKPRRRARMQGEGEMLRVRAVIIVRKSFRTVNAPMTKVTGKTEDAMRAFVLRTSAFRRNLLAFVPALALAGASVPTAFADDNDSATTTPIKHVIVIIGENRSFDQVFATYQPVNKGDTVWNLLSEGIVKPDGSPGPNYGKALQYRGSDTTTYQMAPLKAPYATLPPALVGGPTTPDLCKALGIASGTSCDTPDTEAKGRQVREWAARRLCQVSPDGRHRSER